MKQLSRIVSVALAVAFGFAFAGLPVSALLLAIASVAGSDTLAFGALAGLAGSALVMLALAVAGGLARHHVLQATRRRATAGGTAERIVAAYRLHADGKLRAGWLAIEAADLVFWADDAADDLRIARAEICEATSVANATRRAPPMLCVVTRAGTTERFELPDPQRWCGYVISDATTSSSIA